MNDTIRIVVIGPTRSGKSTITKLISDALSGAGIKNKVMNEDDYGELFKYQPQRLMALKQKKLSVEIDQVAIGRSDGTVTGRFPSDGAGLNNPPRTMDDSPFGD